MQLSAAALSTVINSATDTAIIALDSRGAVLSWNPGAVRLLGWTEEQMRGQTLLRIFPEETNPQARVTEEMTDALSKGRGGHEGWRMRSDGSRFWAVGELTPVTDPAAAPVAFVKVLRDRTQWKVSEDALREEKRTLEVLNRAGATLARENDLAKVVQAVTDAGMEVTGAQFGAFFYNLVNEAGESYTLYTLSGAPRAAFEKFPMPRNTAVFGTTFAGEGIVRSDDITQDPRYGKSAPYHGMPNGHLAVTSYLAVPVVNRASEVIGGLFFGHSQAAVFTERSERSVALLAAEAAIAIDNARLFEAAQREIEERRKAEAALQTLNATLESQVAERTEQLRLHEEALRQAQKMEAVGQLTGGIAHDFNNLLQGIMGNLQLLRKRIGQGAVADLDTYVMRALASTSRAAGLTHRLLAFSRRQPLSPKVVRANPLVLSMQDLLRQTVGEKVELALQLAPGLWTTLCDENQLENAILNLAINARDAMPDGGRLVIGTHNAELDAAYAAALHGVQPGPYVCISVTDTGTGMTAETLAHAFEPFFTTKAVGEGSGLGLSMIYGFARQSEGHARIFSEYGQGTTVRIYLPAHLHAGDSPVQALPAPAATAVSRGEVILVVEDETLVRELVAEVLRDLGYEVLEAHDGLSGLDQLRARERRIDLLITDVGLPGLNGRQVAEAASAERPDLKILFMTGYAETISASQPFASPGMEIMTKPFEVDDMTRRVRALLDGGAERR
ncbi:MAG: response regulator [Acidovorax sp.]